MAKAQAELVNPERSLTATIRTGRPGDGERSFRYAPLSSGLDIVRKILGQHEIATLQTTAIDQTADSRPTVLTYRFDEIVSQYLPLEVEPGEGRRKKSALMVANYWQEIFIRLSDGSGRH